MQVQKAKSGGAKKIGRNKERCAKYRMFKTREKNKTRRMLRSSGLLAAESYAQSKGIAGYLANLPAYKKRMK